MDPIIFILQLIILLISVVIHEVSHGMIAFRLGDPTAKYAGRLTLNPIKHLDLWGSVLIPLFLILIGSPFLFGYAKPVPYNPQNLKNKKWGPAMVAAAGPASNLIIALGFGLVLRFIPLAASPFGEIFSYIVFLNLLLAVFNLVPIPPLDGSKVVAALFPYRIQLAIERAERYGLILVLFFIFFLFAYLVPIILFLFRLIAGNSYI